LTDNTTTQPFYLSSILSEENNSTGIDAATIADVVNILADKIEGLLGSAYPADTSKWYRLYQATTDGFSASDFHRLCDNRGSTIVLIRATSGHIFGGVAAIPWGSSGRSVSTAKSFLFGIRTHDSRSTAVTFDLKSSPTEGVIADSLSIGPNFGNDLRICDFANLYQDSFSELGSNFAIDDSTSKTFFTGSTSFKVEEMEVFQILPMASLSSWLSSKWDSTVLLGRDGMRANTHLFQWIATALKLEPTALALLYRATRDGFGTNDFHSRCDGKAGTVTVVKSESGHVFGGVLGTAWTSCCKGGHTRTEQAFLFGIRTHGSPFTPEMFPIKSGGSNAAYNGNGHLPFFGREFGYDLHILADAHIRTDSYSNFGGAYTLPDGIVFGSDAAEQYFAGTHSFRVAEVEVFQILVS
jgi:hypothetical protein